MMEWILILTLEANVGAHVEQHVIAGFQSQKACMAAGRQLSMVAGEELKKALGPERQSERTTGFPKCIEIRKA